MTNTPTPGTDPGSHDARRRHWLLDPLRVFVLSCVVLFGVGLVTRPWLAPPWDTVVPVSAMLAAAGAYELPSQSWSLLGRLGAALVTFGLLLAFYRLVYF